MNELKQVSTVLHNIYDVNTNGFVQRLNDSAKTIDTCNGEAEKDMETRTCELCVALNQTVFANNNKPEYYHPHCKCKNIEYNLTHVELYFPKEKVTNYLFTNEDKRRMMHLMGYTIKDADTVYNFIATAVNDNFMAGTYKLKTLDIHGQHLTIDIVVNGINEHSESKYKCHIGCIAHTKGKICVITPLLEDKEIKQ